ncbi:hypothetical protein [Agromyces sp. Root1464]|uniref:hypothetical protein n=1 Tax=Agromyces sp. Root1464 TaxID=1736467 RepID=UPI0011C05186|nr:hypothetical protein [Agromyces sp. Root1464]
MSEHDEPDDPSRRPRGRRAAPPSRLGAMLEPALPFAAASVAWLARHRLGAVIAVTVLAVVGMVASGIALMQAPVGGPGNEASTSLEEPRPTSTTPAAPSHYGPVLPTPAPPRPISTPTPTPVPDEVVEPPLDGDEPVEPTVAPEAPDDHPGQGRGPKKPR